MKWSITTCQLRTNDQVFLSCISSGNCFATSFSSLSTSHIIQKQISKNYFTLISSNNFCTTTCAISFNGNFITYVIKKYTLESIPRRHRSFSDIYCSICALVHRFSVTAHCWFTHFLHHHFFVHTSYLCCCRRCDKISCCWPHREHHLYDIKHHMRRTYILVTSRTSTVS